MSDSYTPGIGHNQPPEPTPAPLPVDLDLVLDPGILEDQFATDYAQQVKRRDELLAGATRFHKEHLAITDEAVAAKATDFVGQIRKAARAAEDARLAEGRKFLNATAAVNKFFKAGFKDRLDVSATGILKKLKDHADAKIAAERKSRELEAARLQAEAEEQALAAQASMETDHLNQAARLADQAETAQRHAQASTADLGRVRGHGGSVGAVRTFMSFEVEDLADVPVEYLVLDVAKVRSAIAGGTRDIPGLRIFEDTKVQVR